MRVLCINENWISSAGLEGKPRPSVGDIDVVFNHEYDEHIGKVFYQLERFGSERWYRCDMFAALPDSTADDMQEEEKEAIVNLETVLV
jgi:hypothetical protein